MAIQVKEAAKGNAPATGMQKSPPPDEVSHIRAPSGAGSGMNNDPNPSSIEPGKRVVSPLGANLESSVEDGGVLQHVIEKGTARNDDEVTTQLRDIPRNFPTHPHMTNPNANSATIPGSIPGASQLGGNNSAFAAELAAKQHGRK